MNTHLGIRLILQHRHHHCLRTAGGVFNFFRSVKCCQREAALICEESFKTANPAATADNPRLRPPPMLNQPVCEEAVVFGQKGLVLLIALVWTYSVIQFSLAVYELFFFITWKPKCVAFQDNSALESLQTVPSWSASHQFRPGGHGPEVHHWPHLQRLHLCVRVWHLLAPLPGRYQKKTCFSVL